ncbi:hypothetical protein BJX68DRAFT_231361 [Aspergillus pseudodeflectus]|uniref:DUF7707 domain-containing protein n=2 Tax=Aspergillus subgen. Nidulantes TaxID=2720870 RepID=A0A0U5GN55_ASPCI|nr:hypothetical protein ASPCAL02532 [Aspergillus calidoustus]
MIYTTLLLSLAAPILASNYTFPTGFNLGLVTQQDRSAWCLGQTNACPQICGGAASANRCDRTTLDFSCTCANGTDANVEPYMNTIPYYVCQANYGQCINLSTTQDGDDLCTEGLNSCGTLNASAPTTTSSSTTSSTTSEPTETSTSTNEDEATSTPTTTDSADSPDETDGAMSLMQNFGLAGFATVVVVAFGML